LPTVVATGKKLKETPANIMRQHLEERRGLFPGKYHTVLLLVQITLM
jgi:hypothetical protein